MAYKHMGQGLDWSNAKPKSFRKNLYYKLMLLLQMGDICSETALEVQNIRYLSTGLNESIPTLIQQNINCAESPTELNYYLWKAY